MRALSVTMLAGLLMGFSVAMPYCVVDPSAANSDAEVVVVITEVRLAATERALRVLEPCAAHRKGAARATGTLVGYALRREIFGTTAWTMTVWANEGAIAGFMRSNVHRKAVQDGLPAVMVSSFVRFRRPAKAGPPSLDGGESSFSGRRAQLLTEPRALDHSQAAAYDADMTSRHDVIVTFAKPAWPRPSTSSTAPASKVEPAGGPRPPDRLPTRRPTGIFPAATTCWPRSSRAPSSAFAQHLDATHRGEDPDVDLGNMGPRLSRLRPVAPLAIPPHVRHTAPNGDEPSRHDAQGQSTRSRS